MLTREGVGRHQAEQGAQGGTQLLGRHEADLQNIKQQGEDGKTWFSLSSSRRAGG